MDLAAGHSRAGISRRPDRRARAVSRLRAAEKKYGDKFRKSFLL
jgi:hypothetical protein